MSLTQIIKNKDVHFVRYREGQFLYKTDNGFQFAVPLEDIGKATLPAKDKAIYFLRWIRKQMRHVEHVA